MKIKAKMEKDYLLDAKNDKEFRKLLLNLNTKF